MGTVIGTADNLMSIKLDGRGNLTCDDCNAFFFCDYDSLILKYERTIWNKRGLRILKQQYDDIYYNLTSYDEKYGNIKTIQQLVEAKQGEDLAFLPVFARPRLSRFGVEKSLIESSRIVYPIHCNNPKIEVSCRLKDNPIVILEEFPEFGINTGSKVFLETWDIQGFYDKKCLATKHSKSDWVIDYDVFPCFRGMKIEEIIDYLKKKNVNSISLAFRNALARIKEKEKNFQKTR